MCCVILEYNINVHFAVFAFFKAFSTAVRTVNSYQIQTSIF